MVTDIHTIYLNTYDIWLFGKVTLFVTNSENHTKKRITAPRFGMTVAFIMYNKKLRSNNRGGTTATNETLPLHLNFMLFLFVK